MRYPRTRVALTLGAVLAVAMTILLAGSAGSAAAAPQYDISTLAGKVASLHGTAWLQIRFSAFIEEEAEDTSAPPVSSPITPTFVPGSPLDGNSILPPDVTVNQDTAGAPQNETAIAVNPNNPNQVVAAANDYVSRTWSCSISGTPCSALGDAYSGTYFSNDGGSTWCCTSTDPEHLGTLIPGVERLTGGPYDAGGDPSVAWDTQGHVFYAGLGFNRASAPNTVAVNRGTFRRLGEPQLVGADVHQPDHLAVDAERQGVDRGRRQHVEPVPRPHLRHVHALPLQRAQRRLHAVADLLRVLERRRRDVHDAEVDRRQRALQPGLAPGRGTGRLALRLLGRLQAPRRTGLDLGRQVDGRRCDVGKAGSDRAVERDRAACEHALPGEQLSGGGRRAERRPLRHLDDRDGGRIGRGVEQVDRRRPDLDSAGARLRACDP